MLKKNFLRKMAVFVGLTLSAQLGMAFDRKIDNITLSIVDDQQQPLTEKTDINIVSLPSTLTFHVTNNNTKVAWDKPSVTLSSMIGVMLKNNTCAGDQINGGERCSFQLAANGDAGRLKYNLLSETGALTIGGNNLKPITHNVAAAGGLAVMPENSDVHLAARAIKLVNTSGHTLTVGTPVISNLDATKVRFCAAASDCAYKTDCDSLAGNGGICHLWFEALKNDGAGFGTDSGLITLNIAPDNVPVTMNVKYTQELYAGGEFKQADRINYMAKWNGSVWSVFGEKTNDAVESFAMLKDDLYAGGWFSKVGDISASHVAKWNGDNWSALGDGVDNLVLSLQVMDGDLYAGGWFTEAGKTAANYIAKWDGANWSALGDGLNDWVGSLAVMDDALYVGGLFTKAGNVDANYTAKWDGSNWSALGNGLSGLVHSLIVIDNNLYAGGLFKKTRDNPNRVARWDGRNWLTLGEGVNDGVLNLTTIDSNLYAGGWFTKAESIDANHIARWDGDKWSALGKGLNGIPLSLIVMNGNLYVGGKFTKAGNVAANNTAKWDGGNWSALGKGLNGQVDKLYSVPSLIILR